MIDNRKISNKKKPLGPRVIDSDNYLAKMSLKTTNERMFHSKAREKWYLWSRKGIQQWVDS